MTPVGFFTIVFAIGVLFGGLGTLAYIGLWRSWVGRLHQNVVFGWFWLGSAVLSMGIAASFIRTPVFVVSFVFAIAAAITGGIGLWILLSGVPRRLQPHWYRVERER